MQRAVNPQTGEVLFLVDNKWTPPAQTAKNDAGDTAYLVGNKWEVVKTARLPEPILSPEEQVMGAPSEGGLASIARAGAPKPPSELAPGEEFGKGLGAGFIGLKSTAENVGLMKDIGAMSTVQQRQDLFNKIETGQITSPDQLRGLDETTAQARSYFAADPATREKMRERNVGEIGRRTDFVKTSLSTIDQYQKDAQKYQGRTTDLTDVEGAKDFANWLAFNFGSGAVQLAPLMLAAVATGGAGVAALGTTMGTGEAIGNRLQFLEKRIKDLPPEQRAAEVIDYVKKTGDTALAVGIVSGALDAVLGPAATLAKRGLGEVVKGETRKEALKAGVKEIPKGMGQEFITGGAQEATQLAGALGEGEIDKYFTQENMKKILNAAAAEAAGSIGGGAATTGARVYGADRAIRAKEKRDAEIQALQGQTSELDDFLKTVYGQEPPAKAEGAPVTPVAPISPAAPEAGIAGLMPPAPPAAPVIAPPSEAMDTQAMLEELINSVNYPQEKAPEVVAEKPVEAPPVKAPAAVEAPKEEAPKEEPTLKEQYDKAAKLNLMAPDAFRDRRINQEQYDQIQADYERIKTEYQASIPKATLTPIQQEATDIADRLEELGQKPFVTGMRSAIARNQVNKDNLEFYRSRLKQEQAKQNALDEGIERPSEKFEWTNFFRNDPKDLNKLKLFNSKAPPAVKQALQTVTDTLQALTNRLNDEGYTMYGTPSSTVPQEIKNLRSQIQMRSAGGVKLINAFEALDKGFNRSKKTTNQENLDAAIQDIKVDAAEAQKVLQRSIPEPEEIVSARGTLAEARKQMDTLAYKSGSLWSALSGKLDPEEVREIFGRNPSLGNKKLQVTKKSGKRGTYITELAADGLLDPFLPPAMRHQSSRFDAAESAQYIKDAVANKDYLPHDVKEEIENIQKAVGPLGDLIDEYLTIEEQNRELQIAFDEQREADQAAEIVEPESEDRPAEPSERPAGEFKLTAPTKNELKAKQDEIDRLSKENERLSKEAERKAKADEQVAEFTLTGSDREADQAVSRGQRDIFAEEPKSTGSKSLDALRGVKFTPDEDDKKAIAIYKKIKENNPEADLDEKIANPNRNLPVEEIENRKGLKIGDLVYEKGDPDPNIVITVSEEDVTLVDPNTGKSMGSVDIENVSKDPIPYDYKFDFGYGEINVNVNRWMNRKDEWSVEMSGPGASETGYRNELGLTFKSNRGTPAFEDWVEKVVRIQTKQMAEPRKLAKGKKGKKEAELIEEAPKDNKQEIADLRKEQKSLMLQIIKAGMQETPVQEARMAEIENRINELEGKPAKPVVKQRSVEEIEEDLQDLEDQIDGEILKEKRMPLIEKLSKLEGELSAAKGRAARAAAEAAPTEAETEAAEEAAEEAIRNKAEAEIDEGPIGQAIAKIENGDIETKGQIRTFIAKLERDGTLDDVEDVREGLSDREQDASEVLDTLSGLLDDARDSAIDERFDELLEERAQDEVLPAKEPRIAGQVGFEPFTVEGESRIIDEEVAQQVAALPAPLVNRLEKHYGVKRDTAEFIQQVQADIAKYVTEGAQAVASAIRSIIKSMAEGVLAVGIVFNPNLTKDAFTINLPRTFQQTIEIVQEVPEAAKAQMSPTAQSVYQAMAPVAIRSGKWFMVADKPNGMLHIFEEDGSHALSDPALYGKDTGDVLAAVSSLEGGAKITPAGKFTLEKAGKESLVLVETQDSTGFIAIHAADTSNKAENRLGRLATKTIDDNRISYGCINTNHNTFRENIAPNIDKLNGGMIFVLPDAQDQAAQMFVAETRTETKTEGGRGVKGKAAPTVVGREQQFFSLEKQTGTPAFKKFFGGSKVVDENGNPMIVYHGTTSTAPIEIFQKSNTGNEGYWFGESSLASDYATRRGVKSGSVYPVYLRIERPAPSLAAWNKSTDQNEKKYDGYIGTQADGRSVYAVLDRNQIKSATGNRGTFDESGNISMSVEGKKLPPGRSPELAAAARQVKEGTMTAAEFDKLVNKYRPIRVYEEPLKPATRAEMVDALSSEKKGKVSPDIPEGTRVGLRLDIPAFNRKGVYVVTIHEKGNASGPGKAIGYDSVAVINNVNFGTGSQKKALNIATGEAKDALQTMEGEFVKSDPASVYAAALKAMDDPSWTQIGVDPTRHAYFFDRNTTQPVVAAEQVIQIGNTVLAKNVTYGKKESFLYNLEDDMVRLVNQIADSIADNEKKRSPSFKRTAKTLTRQRGEGKITDEEYLDRMNAAIEEDEESRLDKGVPQRVRGADFIREKLLNAKRRKMITAEGVDLAEWFIQQNPALVDDLGISVKGKGLAGVGGFYNSDARIINLIKDAGSSQTATHEILHHLERMMPTDIQNAIRKAWLTQLLKANKAAKDPAQRLYFMMLLDAHIGNNNHDRLEIPKDLEKIYKSAVKQMQFASVLAGDPFGSSKSIDLAKNLLLYSPTVKNDLYEYFDPSEFWAVNGSDIVQARYEAVRGGVLARLKNWLREFTQKIKSLLGLKSDASIIRALDSLAKSDGKFVTRKMLGTGEYRSIERRNYLGEEAPEPDMEIPEMSFMDDVIYKYGDKLIDTKRLIQSIQSTGRKINERFDAYMKEENYHGRLAKRTKNFLNDEMRPVLEDMQERGVTLDELETFLLNRHAKEANAYIARINPTGFPEAGSSVSDAAADKYMAELTPEKRKDLMALAAKVDAIVKETQRVLVENGLETEETIKEWNATYKHYVPLMRDNLDFVHTGRGVMGGFATRGSASKRRVGSDKPVIDIFANIAMQRERALRRSEQARVGRALYGMAIKHPNPGFWLAINPDAIKDKDKLEAELISLGLTPEDAKSIIQEPRQPMFDKKTGQVKYQVNPLLRNSPNVFPIRINGEDRFIFFNPNDPRALRMVESIKNLDTEKLGDAIGTVGMVTRWFASVNTQYNIVFGGVNFLRDLGAASLNLSTTEIAGKEKQVRANVLPALRAIYRELRGKGATTKEMAEMQNWFERFQLAGGQTGYQNQFAETKRKGNVVEQELKRLNRGNVKKSVDAIFDWLSDYNDAIENAVRLSAFKVAVENGLSEDKAASIAKNLTVNFNRKGARTGLISSLYAFFNAAVQGSARMVETLRGPMGKKIIFGGMFLGSMQAIALAMAGFDDDEPPEFVKDKNLIIPIPYTDKKYLAVPMPLGFNMFPGFGRLAMETLLIETGMIRSRKGPGDKVMSAVSLVFDAFNPLGGAGNPLLMAMPTILDPFAAIYSNKDAFGRPIYREDKGNAPTPGYERSRENASVFSKKLAEAINYVTSPAGTQHTKGFFSPTADQIDYFIGQVTGGVGRELMKVGEFAKSKAVTQEEIPAYKLPIVGRFYGEAESPAATRSRFYENVKEMAKHEYEIKGLRKDKVSPAEYVKANPEARLWQRANNVENQIVKLNKEKRAMLERDAPREAIKRKEDEILKKMTEFNDQVRRGQ